MRNHWRMRLEQGKFLLPCLVFVMAVLLVPSLASATTTVGESTTIGTNLTVGGNTILGDAVSDTITVTGYIVSPMLIADGTNTSTLANTTLLVGQAASFNQGKFYVNASGNVNASGTLAVVGATTLTGALVANGNTTLGDAASDTITVTGYVVSPLRVADGTNTSTLANTTLLVGQADSYNQGKFYVNASGNVNTSGTLAVAGATTLTGALVANGNTTLGDAVSDTITVTGYVVSPLRVADGTNTSTLANTTFLVGQADSYNQGKFYVNSSGNVNASGTLNIVGNVNLNGTTTTLGDATSDNVTVTGYVFSPLRVADGTNTSTLANTTFLVGQADSYNLGKFYVNASGNVSTSGTLKVVTNAATSTLTIDGSTSGGNFSACLKMKVVGLNGNYVYCNVTSTAGGYLFCSARAGDCE